MFPLVDVGGSKARKSWITLSNEPHESQPVFRPTRAAWSVTKVAYIRYVVIAYSFKMKLSTTTEKCAFKS